MSERLERPWVRYRYGAYDQRMIPERAKRIHPEDVEDFIRMWCEGRTIMCIAERTRRQNGLPLSHQAARSHAKRLQDQGFIPEPHGYFQPSWREAEALGWHIEPRGRPRTRYMDGIDAAPDQMEGLTRAEKIALRKARERAGEA